MKKSILLCLAILLLAAVIVPGSAASNGAAAPVFNRTGELTSKEIRLQLSQAGSILEKIQLYGWTKINDSYMSLSALEELAVGSAKALGSGGMTEVKSDETEQVRQTNILIEQAGVQYKVIFQNKEFTHGNGIKGVYETHVIADAAIYDTNMLKESDITAELEELLSLFAESPQIRTTYTAAISGQLTLNRMERINRQIFHGLQGKITEEARDGEWISNTGYSSRIGYAMESNGKQINLNIALRYNMYEDKTYVWLGTPVISIPY